MTSLESNTRTYWDCCHAASDPVRQKSASVILDIIAKNNNFPRLADRAMECLVEINHNQMLIWAGTRS